MNKGKSQRHNQICEVFSLMSHAIVIINHHDIISMSNGLRTDCQTKKYPSAWDHLCTGGVVGGLAQITARLGNIGEQGWEGLHKVSKLTCLRQDHP